MWVGGAARTLSVTMTVHMALDLAKPREVFVSETDSHLCETLVASSYLSQHCSEENGTHSPSAAQQETHYMWGRFWRLLTVEYFTAILFRMT